MILEMRREMSRGVSKTPLPIDLNRFELSYRPSLPTEKKEKKSNWTSIERKMSLTTSLPLSLSLSHRYLFLEAASSKGRSSHCYVHRRNSKTEKFVRRTDGGRGKMREREREKERQGKKGEKIEIEKSRRGKRVERRVLK